jgi:hypothetical protein
MRLLPAACLLGAYYFASASLESTARAVNSAALSVKAMENSTNCEGVTACTYKNPENETPVSVCPPYTSQGEPSRDNPDTEFCYFWGCPNDMITITNYYPNTCHNSTFIQLYGPDGVYITEQIDADGNVQQCNYLYVELNSTECGEYVLYQGCASDNSCGATFYIYGASSDPTTMPTSLPSTVPTGQPSGSPTCPSGQPTARPSAVTPYPSSFPTAGPSAMPSSQPTGMPSGQPSTQPSSTPTGNPSSQPTSLPTTQPSANPSSAPSGEPTAGPSTLEPSVSPTPAPTPTPTTPSPTREPTLEPTASHYPTGSPSSSPSMHHSAGHASSNRRVVAVAVSFSVLGCAALIAGAVSLVT